MLKVAILGFFLVASCFTLEIYADSKTPEQVNRLSVMSYNIQQLGYPAYWTNHFEKERLNKLPQSIEALSPQPDVIIFQEVFLTEARHFLVNALADSYPYSTQIGGEECASNAWSAPATNCVENLHKKLTHNSGVFLLSRWPIETTHSLTFESVRVSYTFDFMARKGAVYARINKNGFIFHVVGTHLQADEASHDIRMAQIEEMMSWLAGFDISNQAPLLYAGDFNISSLVQNELDDLLAITKSQVNLSTDVFSVSPSTNDYLKLIYGEQQEKTLDYILVSEQHMQPENLNELEVLNFKSEKSWQGKSVLTGEFESRDLSDHYPVFLKLEFNGDSGFK